MWATGRRSPTAMLSCDDTTGNTRDGRPCASCVPLRAPPHHRTPRHGHHVRGRMPLVRLGRGTLDRLRECRRGVHEPHRAQWTQELPARPHIVCRDCSVSPAGRSPRSGRGQPSPGGAAADPMIFANRSRHGMRPGSDEGAPWEVACAAVRWRGAHSVWPAGLRATTPEVSEDWWPVLTAPVASARRRGDFRPQHNAPYAATCRSATVGRKRRATP